MPLTPVPETGPLIIVFDGAQEYRGSLYYAADATGGAFPNGIRSYYVWTGTELLEHVETDMLYPVIPGCNAPNREAVLDSTPVFTQAGSGGGSVTLYQCGTPNGTSTWSLTVSDAGAATTVVPAGTFSTHVWNCVWKFGTNERDETIYIFGNDVIERDTTESNSGAPFATYTIKLSSGPTGFAIPMAPVMYSYDF